MKLYPDHEQFQKENFFQNFKIFVFSHFQKEQLKINIKLNIQQIFLKTLPADTQFW